MNKFKYHYIRLKRQFIVYWNTRGIASDSFRLCRRIIRQTDIKKRKSIYDLTDMD